MKALATALLLLLPASAGAIPITEPRLEAEHRVEATQRTCAASRGYCPPVEAAPPPVLVDS